MLQANLEVDIVANGGAIDYLFLSFSIRQSQFDWFLTNYDTLFLNMDR
jgi:hypothetical protein